MSFVVEVAEDGSAYAEGPSRDDLESMFYLVLTRRSVPHRIALALVPALAREASARPEDCGVGGMATVSYSFVDRADARAYRVFPMSLRGLCSKLTCPAVALPGPYRGAVMGLVERLAVDAETS